MKSVTIDRSKRLKDEASTGHNRWHPDVPPIVEVAPGEELVLEASQYVNPLPHVLMLTAIVVGVATTGVALALLLRIHKRYGTLEEDELLEKIRSSRNPLVPSR